MWLRVGSVTVARPDVAIGTSTALAQTSAGKCWLEQTRVTVAAVDSDVHLDMCLARKT